MMSTDKKTAGGEPAHSDLFNDLGEAVTGRRLSDKILVAFNHAYSQGRREIGDLLLQALNQCRELEGADRVSGALEQARLWMRYIQLRERFHAEKTKSGAGGDAFDAMELDLAAAHEKWRQSVS